MENPVISEELFLKMKLEAISKMKNPVLIIHPMHSGLFDGKDEFKIVEHFWMPENRLVFTDESNLYQFKINADN